MKTIPGMGDSQYKGMERGDVTNSQQARVATRVSGEMGCVRLDR